MLNCHIKPTDIKGNVLKKYGKKINGSFIKFTVTLNIKAMYLFIDFAMSADSTLKKCIVNVFRGMKYL